MEPLRIDVYLHNDGSNTERKLDSILNALGSIQQNQGVIMADLTALTAQVAQNTSVESSAITLIQGLSAQITSAGTDPVALAALASQLNTSATALSAAITANTPVTAAQAKATS